MKYNLFNLFPWAFAGVVAVSSGFAQPSQAESELRVANEQFYAALNALFIGEVEPMNAVWSHRDDVTQLGPFGDRLTGWAAVGAEWKKEAALKFGGTVLCKDLVLQVGGELGYAVCVEEGHHTNPEGKPVVARFRATSIFRRENDQWKLVHHHTDLSPDLQKAIGPETK